MIEHFSVQITWKILLKIIKKPWKTQIYRLTGTRWNSILSGKAWNFKESQIKFFRTKHPLEAFPDHSPCPKCPPSKIDFLK